MTTCIIIKMYCKHRLQISIFTTSSQRERRSKRPHNIATASNVCKRHAAALFLCMFKNSRIRKAF